MKPREPLFITERLRARRWTFAPSDMEAAHVMYGDAEVTRYIGGKTMADLAATEAHMQMREDRRVRRGGGWGSWAVELKDARLVVGAALMKPLPDANDRDTEDIEIGWHLARAYWRQGFGTEIGRGLVEAARSAGLKTLHAVVQPPNLASAAVARRVGFTHQGRTRKYYGGEELEWFTLAL